MSGPVWQSKLVGEWLALYKLEVQDSYPVVSELRVLPCPAELRDRPIFNGQIIHPFGPEILAILDGELKPTAAPRGGLTSRLLRKLVPSAEQAQHQETLSLLPEGLARNLQYDPAGEPRRPGRPGHPDRFYAVICVEYLEACAHSRHPVKDVAAAHPGWTDEYARDVIHDARVRGLLTPAPPGKPGGHLTEKALDALKT